MRVLIVSYYFPPAGGGGVQRVLKLCKHLPEFGWDVHVLAPDDPSWLAIDPALESEIAEGTTVRRARYRGPSDERPAVDRLAGAHGLRGVGTRAAVLGRQMLVPDPRVVWVPSAVREAVRVVREQSIDAILTTSPPTSTHITGHIVRRRTGVPWVADLRDSWLANPHHRYERRTVRAKRALLERIARQTLGRASAVTAVTDVIAEEARGLTPAGTPTRVVSNGCDFDDFADLTYERSDRLSILHAGYFFGVRSPRPFLTALRALLDERPELRGLVEARFIGGFRTADAEWAAGLELGDALRIDGFVPHDQALEAMKRSDALLLLIPDAGGIGRSVLSGKVFEYLAAERPIIGLVPVDGAAADLLRATGTGRVADPDDIDAIRATLAGVCDEWIAGDLGDCTIPAEIRTTIDRRTRAEEMAAVLEEVQR